jgi:hypothetical protein
MGMRNVSAEIGSGGPVSPWRGAAQRLQKRVPEGLSRPQREHFTTEPPLGIGFPDILLSEAEGSINRVKIDVNVSQAREDIAEFRALQPYLYGDYYPLYEGSYEDYGVAVFKSGRELAEGLTIKIPEAPGSLLITYRRVRRNRSSAHFFSEC